MATERLRKRLDDGQAGRSNNVNENFCLIGTPLPSLDSKKRDPNEYKPIWQQEVYDDQGRRRFHGAFTGGFSAGYYNTVGSKEGWQPSTFRSSRKDKERSGNKYKQSNAEDFMDEEDLQSYRDGRGALKANDDFLGQSSAQNERDVGRDPLTGLLGMQSEEMRTSNSESNISIQKTSLGTRLLQRMGWREGQGLGAWLSLDRLRRLGTLLGIPVKDTERNDSSSNLYPPPDTAMVVPSSSHIGTQGLGWEIAGPPSTLAELLKRKHGDSISNKPRGGFGIGALEDDSDDEGEVYSTGHRIQDSTLNRKAKQAKGQRSEGSQKHGESLSVDLDEKEQRGRWHDGTPMIPGFILSDEMMEEKSVSASITVPKDWQPDPNRVWKNASSGSAASTQTSHVPPSTSSHRASMFGEARIPGPPPSITDYLSEKDHERLEKAKLAAKASTSSQSITPPSRDPIIPELDPVVAKAALQGFIPFENDKDKQARYRTYLQAQVDQDKSLRAPPGQSIEEFERELREFSRSAAIFKPMNTMMASRFETALKSDQSSAKQMEPGLYTPANRLASSTEKAKTAVEDKESLIENMTSIQRNAKMGLFGPDTTRETKKWVPARLLCKRFNVPHPFPQEMANEDVASTGSENFDEFGESKERRKEDVTKNVNARWEASKRQLQQLAANRNRENGSKEAASAAAHDDPGNSKEFTPSEASGEKISDFDLAKVGLGEMKDDKDESSYVKPSIDLFKFIFAEGEQMPSDADRFAEEMATVEVPSKLLFKPRKRPDTEEAESSQIDTTGKRKKSSDKKSNKRQIRGSLTFNMEEDEDNTEFQLKKSKKSHSDLSKPFGGKPKASDLFDD
ncbi:DUF1604-domain-containing protein [Meira miltonrushii]|uniref:DUF1604-domain-containing protein n=1 Tax=Meira miltonrushii TaxID=1280837 RepID=A0A316VLC0_9BASI|nr:DUF1604-domain-containing protein [Meira miltonrushii]PWN37868.1 DUF1604-domain-containing protein [Meira miltonrushii]